MGSFECGKLGEEITTAEGKHGTRRRIELLATLQRLGDLMTFDGL